MKRTLPKLDWQIVYEIVRFEVFSKGWIFFFFCYDFARLIRECCGSWRLCSGWVPAVRGWAWVSYEIVEVFLIWVILLMLMVRYFN